MNLAARLGTLACALALTACGGASHTDDGGSEDVDGGAVHDGGADEDAATSSDGGLVEGTCTGEAAWPRGHLGTLELLGLGEGPWTATVTAVDATGVDLEVDGSARRFTWPGEDLDSLSPGMEIELSQEPHSSGAYSWTRLVTPDGTLHALHAAGFLVAHDLVEMPITVEGAPPATLSPECTFVDDINLCDPMPVVLYALDVGDVRLREDESVSGPGYAIHYGGAAYFAGDPPNRCEAAFVASLGVRIDRVVEPESCESIEARYAQVVDEKASCSQPTDCRITSGHCGAGIGGCWYAVSGDVSELDALAERYRDLGCTSVVCRCAPPPESASCVAGRCMAD
jgi:hypothetical protein